METQRAGYTPMEYYNSNEELKAAIDLIGSGHFSNGDQGLFRHIVDSLLYDDQYMLFADYQSYIDCQDQVDRSYRDRHNWTRLSILNSARVGKFSSDRSIRDYCRKIWDVEPFPVDLKWQRLPDGGVYFGSRS